MLPRAEPSGAVGVAPAADPVEELLAELQQARAGLMPWPADRFRLRVDRLRPELERAGLARFVAELLGGSDAPDISSAAIDLNADEAGRQATHRAWCALGHRRLPALWAWIQDRRATGRPWSTWWADGVTLELSDDTRARLRDVVAPLRPLGAIVTKWATHTGLTRPTAEHNWRWLALGRGLDIDVPEFPDLLAALVRTFRDRGLLPVEHRVQVVKRPRAPSLVVPVRVPGHAILSVPEPSPPTALSAQYFQHELAHLAELALRPASAGLHARWSLDPVRSEGWALLFELLLRDPSWLRRLGFGARDAELLPEFLREDEEFTKGIIAADIALDERLPAMASVDHACEAARAIARELELEWAPEIMLFRVTAMLDWRSYLAGWAWRDAAVAILERRYGPRWSEAPEAWSTIRATLGTVGSASDALRSLDVLP